MGLKWKSGKLVEDPPPTGFTRRELLVLSAFLPVWSIAVTGVLPGGYAYPKRNWGDWAVFVICAAFAVACWSATFCFWRYAARQLSESVGSTEDRQID
jgi:hypothetical protein